MKRVLCSIGFLCCTAAWALVSAPRLGMVRCRDGAVYVVYGLHANFIFGERAFSLAQAASFSDQGGLVASDGRLQLIGVDGTVQGSYFEGEASPVLSMDSDASSAIAWLPRQGELLVWGGGQFTPIPVALAGRVDSLRIVGANAAELLVIARDNSVVQVAVSLPDGTVTDISTVPSASGSAFYQQSFLLFHDTNGLEVEAPNGSIRTLAIAQSDLSFERIGPDWVHISSAIARRDWVLHLNATVLELSELPQPPGDSPLSSPPPGPAHPRTPRSAE